MIYSQTVAKDKSVILSRTAKERVGLIEAGFGYVCELNGVKLLRKRE
jgi:hypothetical protein